MMTYARIAGRMAKLQLDRIVPSPGFSQCQKPCNVKSFKKQSAGAREVARSTSHDANPEIINERLPPKPPRSTPVNRNALA